MNLEDHPTVKAARARNSDPAFAGLVSADLVKRIALECGADDVGIVELGRESLTPQVPYIHKVYGKTRSLLCYVKRMNREPVRSPTRSVANEEFHGTYDNVNDIGRDIVRELDKRGIAACNAVSAFPMEMDSARIMMVQHKPIAVEAGLGHMGLHRCVIHPRFGSFILLGTVLLGVDADAYDNPIDYNPCIDCKLCVVACPVSAIKPDGYFDFQTCYTHNYHDFLGNFNNWIETIADAKDAKDYRARVPFNETRNAWQSLAFKPQYKAAYCVSVCPAGSEVIDPFLADSVGFVNDVVKPLIDKKETLFVIAGSDAAESVQRTHSHKSIEYVRAGKSTDSIGAYLAGLRLSFQRGRAKAIDSTVHWTFTGRENQIATVRIKGRLLEVKAGQHIGDAKTHVVADTDTWLGVLNRDLELEDVLNPGQVDVRGDMDALRAHLSCFPF
jgi:ferredoxin